MRLRGLASAFEGKRITSSWSRNGIRWSRPGCQPCRERSDIGFGQMSRHDLHAVRSVGGTRAVSPAAKLGADITCPQPEQSGDAGCLTREGPAVTTHAGRHAAIQIARHGQ